MDYSVFNPANPGSDYPVKYGQAMAQLSLDSDKVDSGAVGHAFGYKRNTTTGLTVGFYGGVIISGGALTTIADGTVALTDATTNYVERTKAGVVSKNTSGFSADKIPMFTAVTAAGAVTTVTDKREGNVFGDVVAIGGITSGSVGGTLGSLTLKGTTSGSATLTVDATVTKVTLDKPLDLGANALTAGQGVYSDNVTVTSASTKGFVVNSTDAASFHGLLLQVSGATQAGMEIKQNTGEIRIGAFLSTNDYFPVIYSDGVAALTFGIGATPAATFAGVLTVSSLAGTGTRAVVVDPTGVMSAP